MLPFFSPPTHTYTFLEKIHTKSVASRERSQLLVKGRRKSCLLPFVPYIINIYHKKNSQLIFSVLFLHSFTNCYVFPPFSLSVFQSPCQQHCLAVSLGNTWHSLKFTHLRHNDNMGSTVPMSSMPELYGCESTVPVLCCARTDYEWGETQV